MKHCALGLCSILHSAGAPAASTVAAQLERRTPTATVESRTCSRCGASLARDNDGVVCRPCGTRHDRPPLLSAADWRIDEMWRVAYAAWSRDRAAAASARTAAMPCSKSTGRSRRAHGGGRPRDRAAGSGPQTEQTVGSRMSAEMRCSRWHSRKIECRPWLGPDPAEEVRPG